jgi:hypothetical protein
MTKRDIVDLIIHAVEHINLSGYETRMLLLVDGNVYKRGHFYEQGHTIYVSPPGLVVLRVEKHYNDGWHTTFYRQDQTKGTTTKDCLKWLLQDLVTAGVGLTHSHTKTASDLRQTRLNFNTPQV